MSHSFEEITSFQNMKIKQIKRLRDKRGRERDDRFVIEYSRDLERALDHDYSLDYALFAPEIATDDDLQLLDRLDSPCVFQVSADLMRKASYRQNPSGLLAVMCPHATLGLEALSAASDVHRMLVLVDLKKPGNIGALLRTADATGFDTIVLVDTSLDLYNPNIIRSSTGACFLDNIYYLSTEEVLRYFESSSHTLIAAAVDGDRTLFNVDFRQKSAVLLGTEDAGLDAVWLSQAHQRVQIPMVGTLSDSLNVSVSGAVFMYEALRQSALLDFET